MNAGKLLANITTAIIVLIAVSAIVIVLAPFVGWRADVVMSGSMEPVIPTGGLVIIGPVSASDIRVGDIIAFTEGNKAVCHRVVAIQGGQTPNYVTRGDANGSPDPDTVAQGNIIGKVFFSLPLAGYLISFIKTPAGLFIFILLPLLILIGLELKKLIFNKKEDDSPRGPE